MLFLPSAVGCWGGSASEYGQHRCARKQAGQAGRPNPRGCAGDTTGTWWRSSEQASCGTSRADVASATWRDQGETPTWIVPRLGVLSVADQSWDASCMMDAFAPVNWNAVEALGTSAAFLIAIAVFMQSLRDRRTAQANMVSAWVEITVVEQPPTRHGRIVKTRRRQLVLANQSGQPVFDLHVVPAARQGSAEPLVPTGLPPGERLTVYASSDVGGSVHRLPAPVNLHFTDAAGLQWHRLGDAHRLRRCRWWCRDHAKKAAPRRREGAGPEH